MPAAPQHARLTVGARLEVACCDADHEGEWDGEWEECEVLADHGETCDVRIVSDGEVCKGCSQRHVRPIAAAEQRPTARRPKAKTKAVPEPAEEVEEVEEAEEEEATPHADDGGTGASEPGEATQSAAWALAGIIGGGKKRGSAAEPKDSRRREGAGRNGSPAARQDDKRSQRAQPQQPPQPKPPGPLRMQVACCDADHEGEWDGEWEECEVLADHGETCDVRIVSDGEVCRGVKRRHVRAVLCGAVLPGALLSPAVGGGASADGSGGSGGSGGGDGGSGGGASARGRKRKATSPLAMAQPIDDEAARWDGGWYPSAGGLEENLVVDKRTASTAAGALPVGARLSVRWVHGWEDGTVQRVLVDAASGARTYEVLYDDGERHVEDLREGKARRLDPRATDNDASAADAAADATGAASSAAGASDAPVPTRRARGASVPTSAATNTKRARTSAAAEAAPPKRQRVAAAQPPLPQPPPPQQRSPASRVPRRGEVACCEADHEGAWDGAWEPCTIVAERADTCDVRTASDGKLCRGVPRRLVRAPDASSSKSPPHAGKVFSNAAFLVTGINNAAAKNELLAAIRDGGGAVVEQLGPAETALRRLSDLAAAGRLVLLSEGIPQGKEGAGLAKTTMKLLVGLALGALPLSAQWVHECAQRNEWLAVERRHQIPTTGAARGARGGAAARDAAAEPVLRLLEGTVVVPVGEEAWQKGDCATVLRAAGAEVRRDIPPQHHHAASGTEQQPPPPAPSCVVLLQRGVDAAAYQGLLERARARGVPVASQKWLEESLLRQRLLSPEDYAPA